jgi:hypothetical protein
VWPPALAFHTAVLVNSNTMIVYGGYDHLHYEEEVCHNFELYAYHIDCSTWSPAGGNIGTGMRSGCLCQHPARLGRWAGS